MSPSRVQKRVDQFCLRQHPQSHTCINSQAQLPNKKKAISALSEELRNQIPSHYKTFRRADSEFSDYHGN